MGTAAGVLFSVLFTVLQRTSAAYDPAVRTVVQLSIVCLFFGVIDALMLLTTFGQLQLDTNARGVMRIIAENPSRQTFWNLKQTRRNKIQGCHLFCDLHGGLLLVVWC